LLLEITADSWSAKIAAYVFFGYDCVIQSAVYIFYKPHHFSYKPGHISYELVYISMYPFYKIAYISIYEDPKHIYISAEVVHHDIEK